MRGRHFASSIVTAVVLIAAARSVHAESGTLSTVNEQGFTVGGPVASYCVGSNPSCGRDPWWLQWNEIQTTDLMSFAAADASITVESRYVEALQALWGWGEGQDLVREGSEFGVSVVSGVFEREPTAIASYSTARRNVQINPRYARAATWMLAAVISHELRHISDAHNRVFQAHSTEDCMARETRAYETESRFIDWFTRTMGLERLPVQELRNQSPPELRGLSNLLIRINSAPDAAELVRNDYAELCARNP